MSDHVKDSGFVSVDEALEEIKKGHMIVVLDDKDRENEGDLYIPAEFATGDMINFMITYGRGLVCVAVTQEKAEALELDLIPQRRVGVFDTAFTVSIDGVEGVTTGISAFERATTIQTMARDESKGSDFRVPGHIFPIVAVKGGITQRHGHTEAAVDLARLAGCKPMGVICEIVGDDGHMLRMPHLKEFADHHGLKCLHIKDLIHYVQSL